MTKIGINGFGRIGRLVLRASLDRPGAQVGRERERSRTAPQVSRHDGTDARNLQFLVSGRGYQ